MPSITCPHCRRIGSVRIMPPSGAKVRCPGCDEKFATPTDDPASFLLDSDEASDLPATPDLTPLGAAIASARQTVVSYRPPPLAPPPLAPLGSSAADLDFAPPGLFKPSPPSAHPSNSMPPEPWYYRWLSGIGQIIFVMAVVAEGFALVAALVIFVGSIVLSRSNDFGAAGIGLGFGLGLFYVLWGLVILTPTVILALFLRLAVDLARNVRAMRYA